MNQDPIVNVIYFQANLNRQNEKAKLLFLGTQYLMILYELRSFLRFQIYPFFLLVHL